MANATGWFMTNILSGRTVLVVDDDERMLRALERVLRDEGMAVLCTPDAAGAVETLTRRREPLDLVITDLRMPLVTGMTLLYAIHEIFPTLPTIVLTAFGSPIVRAECLQQGAVAFLEKPVKSQQLLETIAEVSNAPPKTPGSSHPPAAAPLRAKD